LRLLSQLLDDKMLEPGDLGLAKGICMSSRWEEGVGESMLSRLLLPLDAVFQLLNDDGE